MDEPKIAEYSQSVGLTTAENHRLFSSMLTARSWESYVDLHFLLLPLFLPFLFFFSPLFSPFPPPLRRLNDGSASPFAPTTSSEKERIMKTLGARAHEITQVLQNVDPAVILLLKTNDLLRYLFLPPPPPPFSSAPDSSLSLRMLNFSLGVHPIRVYSSVMKHCIQALHEERRKTGTPSSPPLSPLSPPSPTSPPPSPPLLIFFFILYPI